MLLTLAVTDDEKLKLAVDASIDTATVSKMDAAAADAADLRISLWE